MTAAHELLDRGFDVTIYESTNIAGGKARSIEHHGVPAEHGFRFFPGFYKHLPDSMKRTPAADGRSAFDHLVWSSIDRLAFEDGSKILMSPSFPRRLRQIWLTLCLPFQFLRRGLPALDGIFFLGKIWRLATSSWERRNEEYEKIGWFDFVEAKTRSKAYRTLLAVGPTRVLVASKAELANTKTVGNIALQLTFNTVTPGQTSDRLLDGPTNPVWIDCWREELKAKGLKGPNMGCKATGFRMGNGAVSGIEFEGQTELVTADYYISALPVDVMGRLLNSDMVAADPQLHGLETLRDQVNWMNGIQFYLAEDVPINEGHLIISDSPWALTGLSQQQFWQGYSLANMSNGRVRGCLSVDISDWNAKGRNGAPAA